MPKSLALVLVALGFLLLHPVGARAEVEGGKNGIYYEAIKGSGGASLVYRVDTVARLCFAGFATNTQVPVVVPCENLFRRPGWQEIITWVKSSPEEPK